MACAVMAGPGSAQQYPVKPVRIVVAFSPGGTNDIMARLIAQQLSEAYQQTVIVDNRPGAGGNIGTDIVAKAAPDGYTLLLASTGPHAINPHLYPKMPYDTLKEFTAVTLVATSNALLVLHPSVPAADVRQLIALAKAPSARLNYASSGNGSSGHLAGELFKTLAKVRMEHVPYKGNGPAFTDLVAGQVEVMFANKPGALPYTRSGRLKAIAITSTKRDPSLPELPTVSETIPGFEASSWWGVLGPAGLPAPVTKRLHTAITQIMTAPDIRTRVASMGAEASTSSPDEFMALMRNDLAKYGAIVKAAGMRLE
jgi:tripartite-type tricarboxylate transporter receptor subunit TctC